MLIKKSALDALLTDLSKGALVLVPKYVDGVTQFAPYAARGELAFDAVNTLLPPKDMLFPQTEKMYRYGFAADGSAYIEPLHDDDERIIFGIRPCDMRSIELMDDVFLTKGFVDDFYASRRAKLTTVAIACNSVKESCFCDSMGLSPTSAPAADILLYEGSDAYQVVAQSENGNLTLAGWISHLQEGSVEGGAEPAAGRTAEPPSTSCSLRVDFAGVKQKLDAMFDHPIWEQISKKCISCGTCAYVCPTCHCFDISQGKNPTCDERFRCWDSCMFSKYTEMAGRHNPRAQKIERVRNRFMHKLCYFEDRYGKTLCVGCGRCIDACPVLLEISLLIDTVAAMDIDTVAAGRATGGAASGAAGAGGAAAAGDADVSPASTKIGATHA
jgi:ferredoxin